MNNVIRYESGAIHGGEVVAREALKLCPFCGGDAHNVMFIPPRKRELCYFAVQCKECKIKGQSFEIDPRKSVRESDQFYDVYEQAKVDSVEAWNKRA